MTGTTNPHYSKKADKTQPTTDRFLRWNDVQRLVAICRSHAHALAAKEPPEFPRPIKLCNGGRASAWLESEILTWIEQRVTASRPNDSKTTQGVTS